LIDDSYELVFESLTKKIKEEVLKYWELSYMTKKKMLYICEN
jgi:hypothetical protein